MSDPPSKPRGSKPYLPPPPDTQDDSPESVHFPRMEPPPASLEAMVRSKPGAPLASERGMGLAWVAVLLVVIAAVAYYVGLRH